VTGAVEKKRDYRALTVDFTVFFATAIERFVAAFVAMVKQARGIDLLRQ
jgi:hypothetical protein